MNEEMTDTQKFKAGDKIAKEIRGTHPAYGVQHQQPQAVQEDDAPMGIPMWKWWLAAVGLALIVVVCGVKIIQFVFGG